MNEKTPQERRLSDEIRQAIEDCGQSRYRIARGTGISDATLCRFMSGERGLTMAALDKLAAYLGLHITVNPHGSTTQGE